jgi:hypothetical protein
MRLKQNNIISAGKEAREVNRFHSASQSGLRPPGPMPRTGSAVASITAPPPTILLMLVSLFVALSCVTSEAKVVMMWLWQGPKS